ncbi:hypothetical protein [Bradyrhizobium septentrionale]|uniref:Uncharacterized protein n=1 Tax=Bradyrhizobium septentrionale TaxID=1404411 RepID=A0A974A1Q4_9BRAD|nr:hypothetical protein [Bradyrhizobium septentrionale]UGY15336.1 hypothetical protein HAP48_0043575 [Bradyrhizobium septentrionale]
MDTSQRIVTQAPLTELWDSNGPLDAHRTEPVGEADVVRLLRNGSTMVVADVGLPLCWIAADDRFAFWKDEVKRRLAVPNVDRLDLSDYPANYCYAASMWSCASLGAVIVLEKHH